MLFAQKIPKIILQKKRYVMSTKFDGVRVAVELYKDHANITTRSGMRLPIILEEKLFSLLPAIYSSSSSSSLTLDAELIVLPVSKHTKVMNLLYTTTSSSSSSKNKSDSIGLRVFDIIPPRNQNTDIFEKRLKRLQSLFVDKNSNSAAVKLVEYTSYNEDVINILPDLDIEGVVVRSLDATYAHNKRVSSAAFKIKIRQKKMKNKTKKTNTTTKKKTTAKKKQNKKQKYKQKTKVQKI
jgi:ATP-dependent DNA ligase